MDYSNLTLDEKKAKLVELKNKLAELKATQELSGQSKGFESAINKMMDYDPNQAFNLMDRREATELKRLQALNKDQYDPDQVRFKLVSRMNSITGQLQGMSKNHPMYDTLEEELGKIKDELNLDNPSVQHVYSGGASNNNKPPPPPDDTDKVTKKTILADIKGATKGTYDDVAAKVATDKGAAGLDDAESKFIDDALAKKYKELFPAKKVRPTTSNTETRNYALNALTNVVKWSEAYKLNTKVPADRLLLAKIKSRDYANESYMSDDANLSGNMVMQFFKNITGVQELPELDAVIFKNSIPDKYNKALRAVNMYLGDDYITTVSKSLYDNIQSTIKDYPLKDNQNLTGGLKTGTQTKRRKATLEDF